MFLKREFHLIPDICCIGKSVQDKLADLRKHIQAQKAFGTVVSALDEIAWLFNLRGSDIECNPVFFSYAVVTESSADLYLDLDKVTESVKSHLGSDVSLKAYTQFFTDLKQLKLDGKKVLVNNKTSLAAEVAIGEVFYNEKVLLGECKFIDNVK